MGENTVTFEVLSDMLERISKTKKVPVKKKTFRTFLDHYYKDREYFSVMRLILPEHDRERGNYGLKESVLAKCLADALGLAKGSKDAEKLVNWRKGGSSVGKNAGNFALIAAEVVGSRQSRTSGGLKIKQVNDLLDQIVEAKTREEKSKILAELISKTNAVEMKWIIMIILKDLKLGISEKSIFKEFHPDADDVFNKTCDLKFLCEKLRDPSVRYKRQDIEVGKPVRPQLAHRVKNVEEAWKKMKNKNVIAECKFDGDRCQVHKDGNEVHFFSRSSIDHKEFAYAMSNVICSNIMASKCILDGEMVVWNRVQKKFEDFGKIQEAAKNAREGIETDNQLCYIVFDILYVEDYSVMHQPLSERQSLLKQKIKPVSGKLEVLQPGRLNCGDRIMSIKADNAGDIEKFFQMTVENLDEGIVIKDLDSTWEPGDRSGKWLKLKPDYVHPESDLDVLIIGGYYGSGRRGGEIAQFLLALAERPQTGYPTKFVSFCKVGTGLTDDECKMLVDKLRPYFRPYKGTKPPSYYVVTNNAKERPDVWIEQPDKSVLLQISSDIRCIKSEVFASPYSLRFPRIHRVRYDKPWFECYDVQSLVDTVNNKSTDGNGEGQRTKTAKPKKTKAPRPPLIPPEFQQTDVSDVKKLSDMFKGLVFLFVNVPHTEKESLHRKVAEYGGKFSMNLSGDVTHVVADNRKGLMYEMATKRGDVIHKSWFMDSIKAKELLPLRPKYMLHLSAKTKEGQKETLDPYGDHYFVDVDHEDMKQLFEHMKSDDLELSVDDEKDMLQYKKKFIGSSLFESCFIYFHLPTQLAEDEETSLAKVKLRRLEVEVRLKGGAVTMRVKDATHVVVFSDECRSYGMFSQKEQNMLKNKQVLSHKWVEHALESGDISAGDAYDVKHVYFTKKSEDPMDIDRDDDTANLIVEDSIPLEDDLRNQNTKKSSPVRPIVQDASHSHDTKKTSPAEPLVQDTSLNHETKETERQPITRDTNSLPTCKYGGDCYRKNPDHLRKFWHPPKQGKRQKTDDTQLSLDQRSVELSQTLKLPSVSTSLNTPGLEEESTVKLPSVTTSLRRPSVEEGTTPTQVIPETVPTIAHTETEKLASNDDWFDGMWKAAVGDDIASCSRAELVEDRPARIANKPARIIDNVDVVEGRPCMQPARTNEVGSSKRKEVSELAPAKKKTKLDKYADLLK